MPFFTLLTGSLCTWNWQRLVGTEETGVIQLRWCNLPVSCCVRRSHQIPAWRSLSPHRGSFSSSAAKLLFTSQIRTKEGWLQLQGHNWGIYSLFQLCLRQDNYSCIFLSSRASVCTSGKLQSVALKSSPPSIPTSTTNYHTKVCSTRSHTPLNLLTGGAALADWSRALWNFFRLPLWSKRMKGGRLVSWAHEPSSAWRWPGWGATPISQPSCSSHDWFTLTFLQLHRWCFHVNYT